MTHRLPVLIFLFILYSSFFVPVRVNAQTSNPFEDFIRNIFMKNIAKDKTAEELEQINKASLPAEVGEQIERKAGDKKDNKQDKSAESVANVAGQYTIASGVKTPTEVSNSSTGIFDFLINFLKSLTAIFNQGEKRAGDFAGSSLPEAVVNQTLRQDNLTSHDINNQIGLSDSQLNVLGIHVGRESKMEKALPLLQCASLPLDLCDNNRPLWAK